MAIVTLYKVDFNEDNNYLFDNGIRETPLQTITDFPFIKIAPLINIDLKTSQFNLNDINFNYLKVENAQDTQAYYYFIKNIKWKSENCLQLECKIDTLNTYYNDIVNGNIFSNKCYIERETVRRFNQNRYYDIHRKSENITPPITNLLIKESIFDTGINFYLIKRTLASGKITVTAPFTGLQIVYENTVKTLLYELACDGETSFTFKVNDTNTNQVSQLQTVKNINNIDRYDETIINITKLPFFPFQYTTNAAGYKIIDLKDSSDHTKFFVVDNFQFFRADYIDSFLNLYGINKLTSNTVKFKTIKQEIPNAPTTIDALWNTPRDRKYEPKLYHSDFYKTGVYYLNNIMPLPLEEVKKAYPDSNINLSIKQIASLNIDTSFILDYANIDFNNQDINKSMLSFDNELQLYNDAYINYLRNGYNYDKKARDRQTINNILGLTANAVTVGASVALAPATGGLSLLGAVGGATGLTVGTVNTVNNINQSNDNINRKLKETQNATLSASNINSISLQNYYSNKPFYFVMTPPDNVLNEIYNLLYLTGYNISALGQPFFNNRVIFDYIKMSVDLSKFFNPMFYQDLKEKFAKGVYVFHLTRDNTYDTSFTKENFDND